MRTLKLKAITSLALIALWSSCTESPFLSKEEVHQTVDSLELERYPFHKVKNVVAIIDNDVYYFSRLHSLPKRLTQTPNDVKTHVKLSFDRTQIAYQDEDGHPVIIRADNGEVIETLTQFAYIDQMDWAKDRMTLYMLSDREVMTYGEPLEIIQPNSHHPWDEVKSFSINSIGDQAYFTQYYGEYQTRLRFYSINEDMDDENVSFGGDSFDYIDFYDNTGNFLVGYSDPFEDGFAKIACVQSYGFYYIYEWGEERMNTPAFNPEHEVLLYGTLENQVYQIKGVYLGTEAYQSDGYSDILTKVLEDYTSATPVYLDWVQ